MNAEKVQQVIGTHRKKFEELGIGKRGYPHAEPLDSPENGLEYCHGMLDTIEGFVKENRIEKAFRWLGFIQGVLWAQKVYTLAELKSHNRKDSE